MVWDVIFLLSLIAATWIALHLGGLVECPPLRWAAAKVPLTLLELLGIEEAAMEVESIRETQSRAHRIAGIFFASAMVIVATGFTVGYVAEWIGGG